MDSLCHPWFTTTNVSYRFPILKLPPPPCAVLLVIHKKFNYNKFKWTPECEPIGVDGKGPASSWSGPWASQVSTDSKGFSLKKDNSQRIEQHRVTSSNYSKYFVLSQWFSMIFIQVVLEFVQGFDAKNSEACGCCIHCGLVSKARLDANNLPQRSHGKCTGTGKKNNEKSENEKIMSPPVRWGSPYFASAPPAFSSSSFLHTSPIASSRSLCVIPGPVR